MKIIITSLKQKLLQFKQQLKNRKQNRSDFMIKKLNQQKKLIRFLRE